MAVAPHIPAPTYRGNPRRLCRAPPSRSPGRGFFLFLHGDTRRAGKNRSKAGMNQNRRRTGENRSRIGMNQNPAHPVPVSGATPPRQLCRISPRFRGGIFFVLPYYASASILYQNPETDSVRLTCSHYTHYSWKNQADFRVLTSFSQLFRLN